MNDALEAREPEAVDQLIARVLRRAHGTAEALDRPDEARARASTGRTRPLTSWRRRPTLRPAAVHRGRHRRSVMTGDPHAGETIEISRQDGTTSLCAGGPRRPKKIHARFKGAASRLIGRLLHQLAAAGRVEETAHGGPGTHGA
jgi:hypothetical protein